MMSTLTMGRNEATSGLQGGEHLSLTGGILADTAPLAFRGGDTNLYRYVHNDPTNRTDPTGLADNPLYSLPGRLGDTSPLKVVV